MARDKLHQIADMVTAMLRDDGFVCLDAEFEAHTRTLRLYVDHKDGVDIDACTRVSNMLVERVELDELIPCEFNLEVSSPGVDRPVRTLSDFATAKNDGCQISVGLTEKYMNRRKGKGRVTAIDDKDMISMSTTEGAWSFPWSMVLKANRVVDWTAVR